MKFSWKQIILCFTILTVLNFACSKEHSSVDNSGNVDPGENNGNGNPGGNADFDWNRIADSAQGSLIYFYNANSKTYTLNNQTNDWTQYWPTAHTLDVLLDGYLRTKDDNYPGTMDDLLVGMKAKNGGQWPNSFYDDMEWMALATLRAYSATNDSRFKDINDILWLDIKGGWSNDLGGGIWWNKDKGSKNAISNGPASIIASRRYNLFHESDDLEWAKKLYNWEKNTLFNVNGGVWDNISKDGTLQNYPGWIFTYNQGAFLGAAKELYLITGDNTYLQDAIKAADYTLTNLTTNGLLKDNGGGDGGLFNGIFIRYLTDLIQSNVLPPDRQQTYTNFIGQNAIALWTKGSNKQYPLFGTFWGEKPGAKVDLTTQLSGIMLLEAEALLSNKD